MGSRARGVVALLVTAVAVIAFVVGRVSVDVPDPPDDAPLDRALDRSITTNQDRLRELNDVTARQQARDLAAFMERCFARAQTYVACDPHASGLPVGETEGHVNAQAMTASSFLVVAVSRTGCRFMLQKRSGGDIVRSVSGDGCRGNRW